MQTEYKIDLETYNGPLDLLLYLIRRDEVDIYDIPISRIINQYMSYLDNLQKVDIGLAGEFLVMAATLMHIKSQMLLPNTEIADSGEEEDPRSELVKQLLEYKKYKETASEMAEWSDKWNKRFPRPQEKYTNEEDTEQVSLEEIDVWKIAQLFSDFMKQTLGDVSTTIVEDNVPIHIFMEDIINRFVNAYALSFNELFYNSRSKVDIIGFFLALLELTRLKKTKLEQYEDFGDITISSLNGN